MFILIADDEKVIRYSIQSMIEELYPNKHMFITAVNGQDAVNKIRKLPPDIAFLDIRMPLLSGLDVISECKFFAPNTKWVILSGYADFSYAKKAIQLSAFDYLLKPIELITIKKTIDELNSVHEKENIDNNKLFSLDVIRSFTLSEQLGSNELSTLPYPTGNYIIYKIYFEDSISNDNSLIKETIFYLLEEYCKESKSILLSAIFFHTDGELCIVCKSEICTHLIHYTNSILKAYPSYIMSAFYETGPTLDALYDFNKSISEIADIRFLIDCTQSLKLEKILKMKHLDELLTFAHEIDNYLSHALAGNIESLNEKRYSLLQNNVFKKIFMLIDTRNLYRHLCGSLHTELHSSRYDSFINEFYHNAISANDKKYRPRFDIITIKDYVYKNYGSDVSISRLSETFQISPAHFSKMFHEKTGQKYIDFVTEVRISAAKKILTENPDITVKKTAEEVGYSSVRHFSKVFQKYTGALPSNYI